MSPILMHINKIQFQYDNFLKSEFTYYMYTDRQPHNVLGAVPGTQ